MMPYIGKISGFSHGFLIGWVYSPNRLEERIVVEVYGDDYPMALTCAQVWLPELAHIGDGCHGFCQGIPAAKLTMINRLSARVANSDYWLEGCISLDSPPRAMNASSLGYVTNRNGLRVSGWAWNPHAPTQPVKLRIYERNRFLGEVAANQKSAELLDGGIGNGKHGFSFTLPFDLADGHRHDINVLDEQGQALNGCPLSVITYPQAIDDYLQHTPEPSSHVDLLRVLAEQFRTYQEYLPVSVDFSAYTEWAKHFTGKQAPHASAQQHDFLVLVFGSGDYGVTLASLLAQTHADFHVLVQGKPNTPADPRITFVGRQDWDARVVDTLASHHGLLCFVEAGDVVPDQALSEMDRAFANPAVQAAYSDCDHRAEGDTAAKPWFKPDWDLDLFLAQQLIQHLFVVRSGILPLDSPWLACPDAWPWLAIRRIGDCRQAICHIPQVLYHRQNADVCALPDQVISESLPKIAPGAWIGHRSAEGLRVIHWRQPETWPSVTLIVPTRDQHALLEKCITSLKSTDYPELEIIVVDNGSQDKATLKYLKSLKWQKIKVISYPHRFNYSAINNFAVNRAQGAVIGLVNNDVEAIHSDWLKSMVTHLQRPQVGAVGAKLLWPNGMVQHAGVLLGLHGFAGHMGNHWEEGDPGYFGYNQLTRKVSAVTGACLICYKQDYEAIGGLNEQAFPVAFNDVDFCLRLGATGKHIIWTPDAKLWHAESVSRGADDLPSKKARLEKEKAELKKYWGEILFSDPYYNINLNLDRYSHHGLAFPPRARKNTVVIQREAQLFAPNQRRHLQTSDIAEDSMSPEYAKDLVGNNVPNGMVTKSRLFTPLFEKEEAGEI